MEFVAENNGHIVIGVPVRPTDTGVLSEAPNGTTPASPSTAATPLAASGPKKAAGEEQLDATLSLVHYRLRASDTLEVLCLKFGVVEEEVLTANRVLSRTAFEFLEPDTVVLIPNRTGASVEDETEEERRVSRLAAASRAAGGDLLTADAARALLRRHDGDVALALAEAVKGTVSHVRRRYRAECAREWGADSVAEALSAEEAKYYLEEAEWSVEGAVAKAMEDARWQRDHPMPGDTKAKAKAKYAAEGGVKTKAKYAAAQGVTTTTTRRRRRNASQGVECCVFM